MNTHFRKYQLLQLIRSRYEYDTKPQDLILPKLKTNLVIKKIELENNVNLIIKKRDDMFLKTQYGVKSHKLNRSIQSTSTDLENDVTQIDEARKDLSNRSKPKSFSDISSMRFKSKSSKEIRKKNKVVPIEELAMQLKQLDKRQRIELYKKALNQKPPASNIEEAFNLINNTLTEIENKYGPASNDTEFYHSKKYGKMFPLTKDKIQFNRENGRNEMITVGFVIVLYENGGFDFWSKTTQPIKIFSKKGCLKSKSAVEH